MCEAVGTVERVAEEFRERFGRESGGLVSCYRMEDAEVAVFAMGSLLGTIKDTVDEMREKGVKIGVVGLKCYRPFPFEAVRKALANVRAVVVIERMVSAAAAALWSSTSCAPCAVSTSRSTPSSRGSAAGP